MRTQQQTTPPSVASAEAPGAVGSNPPGNWSPFLLATLALGLLWLSFPPIGLWPLGWLAPVPLVYLMLTPQLRGRRPYLQLQAAGWLYWMATLYFIPIPHPLLWIGWFLLSLYLSFYIPFLVGLSRNLIGPYRIPPILAVPVVWTGMEWIRCVLITGFGMACLSHTQYRQAVIIQIADLFGAYTLTFAMVLFATCLGLIFIRLREASGKSIRGPSAIATLVVLVVFGYGLFRLANADSAAPTSATRVAVIQGSIDTEFAETQDEARAYEAKRRKQYIQLTNQAREKWPDLDLVLWPESCFVAYDERNDFVIYDIPPDSDETQLRAGTMDYIRQTYLLYWQQCTGYPAKFETPVRLLGGGTSYDPIDGRIYNAAILVDSNGLISQRYFKNHRVMFGEYVPFSDYFPALKKVPKIGQGLTAGTEPVAMNIEGVNLVPSICFETTVPHFIRYQVNRLAAAGTETDALVNLTNDGWFFGTSCLDLHLACNVFRAVEMRKTNLVCANTGFSAEIDAYGRILQQGPRRSTGVMLAQVGQNRIFSLYRIVADWVPISFATLAVLLGVGTWFRRPRPGPATDLL